MTLVYYGTYVMVIALLIPGVHALFSGDIKIRRAMYAGACISCLVFFVPVLYSIFMKGTACG